MNQKIINELLIERKKKQQLEEERIEKLKHLALKNDKYKKLDVEENSLIIEVGKLEFLKQNVSTQLNKLNEICKAKEYILNSININPKDLCIKTDCPICSDSGFDCNGELCSCIKQDYAIKIIELSNINLQNYNLLKDYDFSVFEQKNKENMIKTVKLLQNYINSYEKRTILNINLLGESGTGKSYLAFCLAKEFQKKNLIINTTTAFNLNAEFLKAHTSTIDKKQNILDLFLTVDILIIDDLGTEPFYNNVTAEYLFLIINERQQKNLTTIITSNLTPTEILDRYGERVFSRIFNKQKALTFNLTNTDLRLK